MCDVDLSPDEERAKKVSGRIHEMMDELISIDYQERELIRAFDKLEEARMWIQAWIDK